MSTLYNPANGEAVAEKRSHSAEEVAEAVARARRAQPVWAGYKMKDKRRIMERVLRLLGEREERLVGAITACTGKTRMDALSTEVMPAAIAARHYPRAAARHLRPRRQRRSSLLFFNKRA